MTFDASRVLDASTDVNTSWQNRLMTRTISLTLRDTAACCTPVTEAVLSAGEAEQLARTFKALGDPTRMRLLSLIAASTDGEACICDLTEPVGLSQPTVSHHMKLLVEAGLATREQRGRWAYYRVVRTALERASSAIRP